GEVSKAMIRFRNLSGTYPWLAPFTPETAEIVGQVGITRGLMPFHIEGQEFTTDFTWSTSCSGPPCFTVWGSVTENDMRNTAGDVVSGTCRWKHNSSNNEPLSQVSCRATWN